MLAQLRRKVETLYNSARQGGSLHRQIDFKGQDNRAVEYFLMSWYSVRCERPDDKSKWTISSPSSSDRQLECISMANPIIVQWQTEVQNVLIAGSPWLWTYFFVDRCIMDPLRALGWTSLAPSGGRLSNQSIISFGTRSHPQHSKHCAPSHLCSTDLSTLLH